MGAVDEGVDLAAAGVDDLLPRLELDRRQVERRDALGEVPVVGRQLAGEALERARPARGRGVLPSNPQDVLGGQADDEVGGPQVVGDGLPGEVGDFAAGMTVVDIVPAPAPTALLRKASAEGAATIAGSAMTDGQATALLRFFGIEE